MDKNNKGSILAIIAIIFVAISSRFLPHPPNFTALGAVGLFGGYYFTRKYMAFLIPLGAFWLSDLFLNNVVFSQYYEGFVWMSNIWSYIGLACVIGIGMFIVKKIEVDKLLGASLLGSMVFFLLSNFGVWLSGLYTFDATGFVACYTAALPFFWNTILGDMVFTAMLFGGYELFVSGSSLRLNSARV